MGILALTADERVTEVKVTKDTLIVGLRDGRTIMAAARVVSPIT